MHLALYAKGSNRVACIEGVCNSSVSADFNADSNFILHVTVIYILNLIYNLILSTEERLSLDLYNEH